MKEKLNKEEQKIWDESQKDKKRIESEFPGDWKIFKDYKGFEYTIGWCHSHICGYIKFPLFVESDTFPDPYCGITFNRNGIIGFDCGHVWDSRITKFEDKYIVQHDGTTYKNYDFVLKGIKRWIDEIIEWEKENKNE